MPWLYALGSVVIVSLISLIGVLLLSLNREKLQNMLTFLVSLAVGALAGDAFIHLIPEAFEELGIQLSTSLLIFLGLLVFFTVEKGLRWRHCHIPASHQHLHPVVTLNLIGDGVHNLIDGMLIGAAYMVSIPIGVTTTLAVLLHEIPQELGDFGVLVYGGLPVRKALLFNFASSVTAILGTTISLLIGNYIQDYSLIMLPITAGGFLYIAGSDLIPELQNRCERLWLSAGQAMSILLGVGLMALLTLVE